jgi:hypothetical protein
MTLSRFLIMFKTLVRAKGDNIYGQDSGALRVVSQFGGISRTFCPITYVAAAKTGRFFVSSDYASAANALDLPRDIANLIANAADIPWFADHERATRHNRVRDIVRLAGKY